MKTLLSFLLGCIIGIGTYMFCTNPKQLADLYNKYVLHKSTKDIPTVTIDPNALPAGLVDHTDTVYAVTANWYHNYLKGQKLCNDANTLALVKSVTDKLIPAANQYMNDIGQGEKCKKFKWEVNVVESNEVNAWCAAGGKIVVYTGILKYTGNDKDKIATVLGHEISHALEDHTIKQSGREGKIKNITSILSMLISKKVKNKNIVDIASNLVTKVGVRLPVSRAQERQADHVGIELMYLAGFDMHKATEFWEGMAGKHYKGCNLIAIGSTHPSDFHRIDLINKEINEIETYGIAYVENKDNSNFKLLAAL